VNLSHVSGPILKIRSDSAGSGLVRPIVARYFSHFFQSPLLGRLRPLRNISKDTTYAVRLCIWVMSFRELSGKLSNDNFSYGGFTHMYLRNVILGTLALAMVTFAQGPATTLAVTDAPFQTRYASNLPAGESYINVQNDGANGAPLLGPGLGGAVGNICVNVYAFDPAEEMISCCSCLVTPDQTKNLGVNRDIISNTATGTSPTSVTIKLLATLAGTGGSGTSCTNSAASVNTATIVAGLAAWGTTLHTAPAGGFATTETAFTPATLSAGELAHLANTCSNMIGNLSGFGICASCRTGSLGSVKAN
jgi:hypothetical protein